MQEQLSSKNNKLCLKTALMDIK